MSVIFSEREVPSDQTSSVTGSLQSVSLYRVHGGCLLTTYRLCDNYYCNKAIQKGGRCHEYGFRTFSAVDLQSCA